MTIDISQYRINHYSQFGEDGVIEKLFEILNINSGWLVEFGAWDGIYLSNTYYHYQKNKNFNLLLIESDNVRFEKCLYNFANDDKPVILNRKITLDGKNSLNNILEEQKISEISLLSIDIDGMDTQVWASLNKEIYKPKIVIIEFDKWQDTKELEKLVEIFPGYNLICVTSNFIFARADLGLTSRHDIFNLLLTSGSIDYNLKEHNLTKKEYEEISHKIYNIKEHPDIFKNISQPQYISYEK